MVWPIKLLDLESGLHRTVALAVNRPWCPIAVLDDRVFQCLSDRVLELDPRLLNAAPGLD